MIPTQLSAALLEIRRSSKRMALLRREAATIERNLLAFVERTFSDATGEEITQVATAMLAGRMEADSLRAEVVEVNSRPGAEA